MLKKPRSLINALAPHRDVPAHDPVVASLVCGADGCGKTVPGERASRGAAYCGPACRAAQKNRRQYARRKALIEAARKVTI